MSKENKYACKTRYYCFAGPTVGQGNIDSARQNLASSFVNGLVNAGFGKDKLLSEEGNPWLYKNKEHGKFYFKMFNIG